MFPSASFRFASRGGPAIRVRFMSVFGSSRASYSRTSEVAIAQPIRGCWRLLAVAAIAGLAVVLGGIAAASEPIGKAGKAGTGKTPDPDTFAAVPGLADDIVMRGGLARSGAKFASGKAGVVAYLGGSITHNPGWTQMVDAELQRRFPATQFTFIHAGIPSIDSTGHAFRFASDVMEKGLPDLLFVEAAVNDLHNDRAALEQRRGMEGVIRRALRVNRWMDIVMLHFAEPRYTADYQAGRVPEVIANHEAIAAHYGIPSVNLARETQRRIDAGQFDWARDFRDLHPSPFGQRLYFLAVRRLFDQAWPAPAGSEMERTIPEALDKFCYDAGEFVPVTRIERREGFSIAPRWKPEGKAGVRAGFVDVPMLVGEHSGASFTARFEGRGIGLFLTAGPDAATLEYRIDRGPWKTRDSFTRWSRGLHLPWALMLETELESGPHELEVRLAEKGNPAAVGAALRVRDILVNGPAYDVPKLTELVAKSSLDGTMQPSLYWAPDRARSEPTPLLVFLHSWSGDYRQDNSAWQQEAVKRGWSYLHPNFRGVNRQPEACGSRFARQDVIDAIDALGQRVKVDPRRIYVAGTSGGGHMAMLMAAYFPERFAAVSAWVGIADLADWHDFHVKDVKPDRYAIMTRDSLGGPPGASPEVDAQYRERSPIYHLARSGNLPIELAAGVKDGKTGSVPIHHSLRAFNVIASSRNAALVPEADIDTLWNNGRLAQPQPGDEAEDATLGRAVLLRRHAGSARVTIFDGGHEGLARPACEWLERHVRAE
jgi:pimeloyl-ACP methyl ester carboxylesterase/lysophospholipase L1-like esterase